MGAERVIAIDHFPHRLELAKKFGAETINFEQSAVYEALMEMTGGIGPDAVIDSVGLEAHGFFVDNVVDQIKKSTFSAPIASTRSARRSSPAARAAAFRCPRSTAASSTSFRSARSWKKG